MTEQLEVERVPLAPGAQLRQGMYRIERLLGEGGYSLVYLARQGRWNLQVVIKEFFPVDCQRQEDGIHPQSAQFEKRMRLGLQAFQDEAATLARFQHAGIVRVLDSFEENRTAYLVQEYLEGMTFRQGLGMAGRMPTPLVLEVALQVGHALLMVHAAGLVHSDLKPDNLFLTNDGRYVILDFGLTRGFLSEDGARTGGRGLTPGYCPPEQYARDAILTPATDVYSFAATLYCLLTGTPPPDAPSRNSGQGIPAIGPLNPTVTPAVENALVQAMIFDPKQRTPGIREFLFQLGLDSTPKAVTYRPASFQARGTLQAHHRGPVKLALHIASQRLYSGAHDGSLRAWNWPDMQGIAEIPVHEHPISALAVSHDGRYLISGTEAGEVRLTPTDFAQPGLVLTREKAAVSSVSLHGDLVAASFANGKCCLLSPALPSPILWEAHMGPANCVKFHPDGSYLASGGKDGAIRFWAIPQPTLLGELKGHKKSVTSVAFSPDGTSLLSSSADLSVKFWDLPSLTMIRDLRGHASTVLDAQFTCLENYIVSLAGDHTLRGFSLESARLTHTAETRLARTLLVHPDLPLVLTASEQGQLCLWEI